MRTKKEKEMDVWQVKQKIAKGKGELSEAQIKKMEMLPNWNWLYSEDELKILNELNPRKEELTWTDFFGVEVKDDEGNLI